MRRSRPLPIESAKAAHCRYVDDRAPGIERRRVGRGFTYVAPNGRPVRDPETLRRIRALVIPPAWTSVWICADPRGHIQATGRDARGRKQYRYHPRFREIRDETKFERMIGFAEVLPKLRAHLDQDLSLPGLARDKVLATVVRLLEITLIRVGNEEYARTNGSFGLTTMRSRHVDVVGSSIAFRFRGKSKKHHEVHVTDRRLARVVARCHDLPGEELFRYLDDDGELRTVESDDVNAYIRRATGADFTAKDIRTWAGTVLAAEALHALGSVASAETKRALVSVVKEVAERLGNTPAVCRRCYVHPRVFEAFSEGALALAEEADAGELSAAEASVLRFLREAARAKAA